MPRLRILAGPSPSSAVPIPVNDGVAHEIKGSQFEGHVSVYMRYEDEVVRTRRSGSVSSRSSRSSRSSGSSTESIAEGPASAYFGHPDRAGVTWSIQIQGRFITPVSADDVLFGNTFERPLKLPWGSSAALRFMNFIDPTLEHDLGGPKPWALSPLVSTMPYLAHSRLDKAPSREDSQFPPERPLIDFCGSLIPNETSKSRSPSPLTSSSRGSSPGAEPESPAGPKRRNIFRSPAARRAVTLGPNDLLTADFCYGFLSFPSLTLKLPGGIRFDCMKYWDQQPVTFMCCQRGADGSGPGEPFWCVIFEVAEDEDDAPADSPAGTGDRVDEVDSE